MVHGFSGVLRGSSTYGSDRRDRRRDGGRAEATRAPSQNRMVDTARTSKYHRVVKENGDRGSGCRQSQMAMEWRGGGGGSAGGTANHGSSQGEDEWEEEEKDKKGEVFELSDGDPMDINDD